MKRVFVDTSVWYAYVRADDPDHKAVKSSLEQWEGRLLTSNFVFDEVVTLVRARLGAAKAERVGNTLRDPDTVNMVRVLPEDEEEAWKIFTHPRDKEYSFTDCVSFALMHRLGLETVLSTDHHFQQAGFHREP